MLAGVMPIRAAVSRSKIRLVRMPSLLIAGHIAQLWRLPSFASMLLRVRVQLIRFGSSSVY